MNKITICFKNYFSFTIFYFVLLQLSAQTTVYSENFSTGANGWTTSTSGSNNSQWRFTTVNPETTASSGATGDYAYSRRHGAGKQYKNKTYITNTKAVSTAGYNTLTLSLSVWYKSETNYDGMNIEYSLNNGATWSVLGTVGSGTNWYNTTEQATSNGFPTGTAEWSGNSGGWVNASINLSAENAGFNDNAQVMFRVNLASDSSVRDTGVAFDTFKVTGTLKASGPEINIKGFGNSIIDGDTTPSTADATNFGNVITLNTTVHNFTIENLGNLNLDLTGASPYVTISGANASDFSITAIPSTPIASSTNTTFSISFTPSVIGLRTATISINNNDSNENPYNFSISGNGVTTLTTSPGGVTSGLKLWLRADKGLTYTDGQGVALWSDQGTAGTDATVHRAGQEPTFRDNASRNVNFNPVIDFVNVPGGPISTNYNLLPQQYLESVSGFYTQDIFVVALPHGTVTSTTGAMDTFTGDSDTGNATDQDVTGIGYGNYSVRFSNELLSFAISTEVGYGRAHTSTTASYSQAGIVNATNNTLSSPTKEILYYNGNDVGNTEKNASQFKNVSNSRYWIGRSQVYTASFYGRLPEIINFSTKLSAIDRNKVQSYLAIKYGITLLDASGATTNYTSANGTKIWDATANAGFNSDVAGIGRDDAGAFLQKQSKSVNTSAIITIGLGTIAATNNLNTNTFTDDGDYLVWGSNGAALNTFDPTQNIDLSTLPTVTNTTFTPISRKWKIVETATADIPEVLLSIPTATLTSNIPLGANEEYSLVVSDNAAFGANDIIDVIPLTTNGANSEITYDFDGTKYFTIAKTTQKIAKRSVGFSTGQFLLGDKTLELTNSFTVSAWIKNNGTGGTFISKGTAYNFKIDGANKIEVDWNGTTQLIANTVLPVNKWHHIALTFSGGTANLYIDGVLDKTVGSLPNPTPDNSQRFTIGALYTNKTTVSSFDGAIDEVRIWSAPLSITEIRYIMNQEIQISGANTTGVTIPSGITKDDISTRSWNNLKAYYDMNAYYGTSVEDRSNNKNWLRINYLIKNKKVAATQTAPLPYQSTANGTWNTAASWANNSVNDIPNIASIVNPAINIDWNIVETQNNIFANRTIKLLGLISNSGILTVNSANELNISHYLKLDGKIDLQGESQLVQTTGSDLDVTSGGTLERDQQGTSNSYKYNYWSSPVGKLSTSANNTPHSIADVLRDGTNPATPIAINFQAAYNAADGSVTSPIILSTYWMNTFVDKPGGDYDAWTQIGDTGILQAGQGYTMKGSNATTSNQNYTFIGKPNNGDINLTISVNNNYLVGNPYPSAIDANAFINDNLSVADGGISTAPSSIDGTLYFWDHFGGGTHNLKSYEGGYGLLTKLTSTPAIANDARINNTGSISTLSPKRYIPVAQGFFVNASTSGGTIAFKNSQRIFKTEASGSSQFLKANGAAKSNTTTSTTPIIRLQFDSPDGWHREIALGFNPKTTNHFDIGYDGRLIEDNAEDMYWIIDKGKYVIQGVKKFNKNGVLPLGLKIAKAGTAVIKLKSIENLPVNTKVYIKDKLTGKTTNINVKNYTINLKPGIYIKRFSLVFKSKTKYFGHGNFLSKKIITYYNKANEALEFFNFSTKKIIKIKLMNFSGRTIKVWQKNLNKRHLSLKVPKLDGIYIIKIYTNKGLVNKKILIH